MIFAKGKSKKALKSKPGRAKSGQTKKHMRISQKLIASFLGVSLITAAVSGIGIYGLENAKNTMDGTKVNLDTLPMISNILTSMASVQAASRDALLNYRNTTVLQSDQKTIENYEQTYNDNATKLLAIVTDPEWKERISEAQKSYAFTVQPQITTAMKEASADDVTEANNLLQTSNSQENQVYGVYASFMDYCVQEAHGQYDADNRAALSIFAILLVFAIAGILLSVLLGIRISLSISKPLAELAKCSVEFSNGNLQAHSGYESGNEIGVLARSLNTAFNTLQNIVSEISTVLLGVADGNCNFEPIPEYHGDFKPVSDAMNTILNNLNRIFTSVLQSAEQVDSGAKQVADGSQGLARGATEQAGSVEELTVSIEDVSSKVNENSEQIGTMADFVNMTAQEVAESNERMRKMLSAMNEINVSSAEIGKIVRVIDSIAFQTNILALNASVEAARAGAAGRGFAVVAEEVRNLATKSAEAAKQTASLILNSSEKVEEGLALADETAKSLSDIAGKIHEINESIQNIKKASEVQSNSVGQITQGIGRVSSVIQTNSATAQESAAASEQLSSHAELLRQELGWIQLRRQETEQPVLA